MKLGKLCILFTDGDWIESKDQSDSGIRLIQTGNIGNGEFLYKNDKAKYISVDTFKRLNCKEVFPNDILVSRLPEPVGRGCIIPDIGEKMITAVDCTICRINENLVDRKYFCYFLESNAYKTQLEQHVTGTTRKRISRKNLSSVEIDIPEQAKQKEVVYKLDRLKKIIQNYNRELDLLDELVRARFVEMFGDPIENQKDWEVVKIRDIVTDVRYGTSKPAVEGGRYPYLRMNNLTVDGGLDLSDLKYIDIPDNEIEKCVVRKGDILFNRTNSIDLIGKTAVFNLLDDMVIAGYIIRIRLNNQILPDVFSQYMNLEVMKKVLRGMAKGAVNQANINAQELQSIKVYIPDMELQRQYVEFKEEIDKSRLLSNHSLFLIKSIIF